MMRQRKSLGKKNKTIEEFRKQLPNIARTFNAGDDFNGYKLLTPACRRGFSRGDRSISLRATPKTDKRESKSFGEDKERPRLLSTTNQLANTGNMFKELTGRRNKTLLERPKSPALDLSLGEALLSRSQLYNKIKSKPHISSIRTPQGDGNTKLGKLGSMFSQHTESRSKKKSCLDSTEIAPHLDFSLLKPFLQFKKSKPIKSKPKSLDGKDRYHNTAQIVHKVQTPNAASIIAPRLQITSLLAHSFHHQSQGRVPYKLIPNIDPARKSSSKFKYKYIKSYGVNTFKGLIREYNEDRVSIILNILQPAHKKGSWPNCSFFAVVYS